MTDGERHFQSWLDKNSWRRDIQRLEKEYGAAEPQPGDVMNGGLSWSKGKAFTDEFSPLEAPDIVAFLVRTTKDLELLPCRFCEVPCRGEPTCSVCQEINL